MYTRADLESSNSSEVAALGYQKPHWKPHLSKKLVWKVFTENQNRCRHEKF